jgi:hypothetical protein
MESLHPNLSQMFIKDGSFNLFGNIKAYSLDINFIYWLFNSPWGTNKMAIDIYIPFLMVTF